MTNLTNEDLCLYVVGVLRELKELGLLTQGDWDLTSGKGVHLFDELMVSKPNLSMAQVYTALCGLNVDENSIVGILIMFDTIQRVGLEEFKTCVIEKFQNDVDCDDL